MSPDTVVRWHRAGFRLYWRLISRVRKPVGRRPVTEEIRELIPVPSYDWALIGVSASVFLFLPQLLLVFEYHL